MSNTLNTFRVLEIEKIPHGGTIYFRTREVAEVLGIKQPFELTSNMKKCLGDRVVRKGLETIDFRTEADDNRTTFISASDLRLFLSSCLVNQKMLSVKRKKLLEELKAY